MSKMFIAGDWVEPADGETIPVLAPADGNAFATIGRGKAADVDRAVIAARRALDGAWGRFSAAERGRVLMRVAQKVQDRAQHLAQLEARDTGKPLATARNDIGVLARYFEFYGSAADKVHGQIIPFLHGHNVSLLREPHGVTGHIIPWNYPAQILGRTIAPRWRWGTRRC
jgi:aldehyde dehydrogenase (NAD+)